MATTQTAEYDRLLGKWVLSAPPKTRGLFATAGNYEKWEIEYTKDATTGAITKKEFIKMKLVGFAVPQLDGDVTFKLTEDRKRPGTMVLEHKFKQRQPKHCGMVHYRNRIISKGNGTFQDSRRGGFDFDIYPRFTEDAAGYNNIELDDKNETMSLSQRPVYGGVAVFVKAKE